MVPTDSQSFFLSPANTRPEAGASPPAATVTGVGIPPASPVAAGEPAPAPAPAKVKLTKKVRRGLALMRTVLVTALDPADRLDHRALVATWTKSVQSDFNAAMQWVEQNERDEGARA